MEKDENLNFVGSLFLDLELYCIRLRGAIKKKMGKEV